jgi:hypothetical protein
LSAVAALAGVLGVALAVCARRAPVAMEGAELAGAYALLVALSSGS